MAKWIYPRNEAFRAARAFITFIIGWVLFYELSFYGLFRGDKCEDSRWGENSLDKHLKCEISAM